MSEIKSELTSGHAVWCTYIKEAVISQQVGSEEEDVPLLIVI